MSVNKINIDPLRQRIVERVEAKREDIVEFTRELLCVPSDVNPPYGNEKKCQELIADRFRHIGIRGDMFDICDVEGIESHPVYAPCGSGGPRRDYRDRPNLAAKIEGSGGGRSLILTGHVDVVPPWDENLGKHAPWGAEIECRKLFARGAVDDKGPLTAVIMAIECIMELGITLKGDLIFESVVDEEFGGCNGSLATVVRGYKADAVILVEPTDMAICPAGFGCMSIDIEIKGRSVHPFQAWKGINPIGYGLRIYQALRKWEISRDLKGKKMPLFRERKNSSPMVVRSFNTKGLKAGGAIPEICEIGVWSTVLPGESKENILSEIKEEITKACLEDDWLRDNPPDIKNPGRYIEPFSIDPNHPIVQSLGDSYRFVLQRDACITAGTSGDMFVYANYGQMPGIMFGPGELYSAHGADEYIELNDLINAIKIYALTILDWCGI